MICNKITGTLEGDFAPYREVDGETFLVSQINLGDVTLPIVVSEYMLESTVSGLVEANGYIRSETDPMGKLFTHFRALLISTTEATRDNQMFVEGRVHKVHEIKIQNAKAVEVLQYILKYRSPDGNFNVVHCVAKGVLARKLHSMQVGDNLIIEGRVVRHNDSLEVSTERVIDPEQTRRD